jgi:hypothetical protein
MVSLPGKTCSAKGDMLLKYLLGQRSDVITYPSKFIHNLIIIGGIAFYLGIIMKPLDGISNKSAICRVNRID